MTNAGGFDWRGVGEFAGRRTEEKLGPWPGFFLRRIDQEGASKCAAGCDRRGFEAKAGRYTCVFCRHCRIISVAYNPATQLTIGMERNEAV